MQKDNSFSAWSPPPPGLDLQTGQVDIWRIKLNLPDGSLELLESTLSAAEAQRAQRFHFPQDRKRFIAAHGCLRKVLAGYLHCEPGKVSFSKGSHGKPGLATRPSQRRLEFNLSHSADFALIAVTWERRIGVDVEQIRPGLATEDIAWRYFSQLEVTELMALYPEQRETAFFQCWTRKEAYIKAQGSGLSLPLESFDVSLTPNDPAILRATRPDLQEAACWTLFSLEIDPRYAAAVAVEGQGLELRLWDWGIPAMDNRLFANWVHQDLP